MEGKYTIRDFLVYFLTGLYLLLTLLYQFDTTLLTVFHISKQDIKENPVVTIFLLIPGLYLVGHVVHGVDSLAFKMGRIIYVTKNKNQKRLKKIKVYWLFNLFSSILNGTRVIGILDKKGITPKLFWKKVSILQYNSRFEKAEYWNLMKDLFLGLALISFSWVFYFFIHFTYIHFCSSLLLSLLFWYRARQMAVNFVSTVNNTYDIKSE